MGKFLKISILLFIGIVIKNVHGEETWDLFELNEENPLDQSHIDFINTNGRANWTVSFFLKFRVLGPILIAVLTGNGFQNNLDFVLTILKQLKFYIL